MLFRWYKSAVFFTLCDLTCILWTIYWFNVFSLKRTKYLTHKKIIINISKAHHMWKIHIKNSDIYIMICLNNHKNTRTDSWNLHTKKQRYFWITHKSAQAIFHFMIFLFYFKSVVSLLLLITKIAFKKKKFLKTKWKINRHFSSTIKIFKLTESTVYIITIKSKSTKSENNCS